MGFISLNKAEQVNVLLRVAHLMHVSIATRFTKMRCSISPHSPRCAALFPHIRQDAWLYFHIHQHVWLYFHICQDARLYFHICQDAQLYFQIPQDDRLYFQIQQGAWLYFPSRMANVQETLGLSLSYAHAACGHTMLGAYLEVLPACVGSVVGSVICSVVGSVGSMMDVIQD